MENEILSALKPKVKNFKKTLEKKLSEMGLESWVSLSITVHNIPKEKMPANSTRHEDDFKGKKEYYLHYYADSIGLASVWADVEFPEAENTDGLLDDYNQDLYLIEN